MKLFGTASSKQVDDFAKGLAQRIARECPPSAPGVGKPAAAAQKLAKVLEDICRQAIGFRQQHRLGLYKKARLGNTFRWELKELGYDPAFVEEVTQRLVIHIARKDGSAGR